MGSCKAQSRILDASRFVSANRRSNLSIKARRVIGMSKDLRNLVQGIMIVFVLKDYPRRNAVRHKQHTESAHIFMDCFRPCVDVMSE